MERKPKKSRSRRAFEQAMNELAIRTFVIVLLCYVVVLFAARPPWVVNAVRLLADAAKGVGAK